MVKKTKCFDNSHDLQDSQNLVDDISFLANKNMNIESNPKQNISKFHKSMKYIIHQCKICFEAWPSKRIKSQDSYIHVCQKCSKDKAIPSEKFSDQNFMIPSAVPLELQELTQVEEMLIACAIPIMRVYVKPGGQRGYSGHCINLPQQISELAEALPRYTKDIPLILVTMNGKDNNY